MSETRFTPGPWQVNGVRYKWREVGSDQVLDSHTVGPDGDAVALIFYAPKWHIEQLANARLIAVAPDLYTELKACIQNLTMAMLVMDAEARAVCMECITAHKAVLAKAVQP